eukprot:scaffold42734_cov32-Cyclotella_meneghiniana.AAC.1
MNVMHYDPMKALSLNLYRYEDLMHNNLASWLNRIDEIVGIWERARWRSGLGPAKYIAVEVTLRIVRIFWTRD